MPPRLTLREIQARRQRAEEGVARVESLKRQFHAETMARMDQGALEIAGIARATRDAAWQRRVQEIQREMAEATEMIRGGMPRTSIELAHALTDLGVILKTIGQVPRSLPVLFEALALLKSERAPSDPRAWLFSLLMASMTAAFALKSCNDIAESARILEDAMEAHRAARARQDPKLLMYLSAAYLEMGYFEKAEPLRFYLGIIEKPSSLGWSSKLKDLIHILRSLVETKRQLGKEEEARALEQDLDETEAIMQSSSAAALDEVRAQLRAEAAAAAGVGGAGAGGQGLRRQQQEGEQQKKKPTRKQQKRKAAQRRKQAAEAAVAAGTAVAEGGGVEAVTAAAGQLRIDEPEPDFEPEPEPTEPEPEPEECAICLNDPPLPGEEEGGGGAVLLACSHIFHTLCLEGWKDKCLEKGLPYTGAMCRAVVVLATPTKA